jgi:hypothetical protein
MRSARIHLQFVENFNIGFVEIRNGHDCCKNMAIKEIKYLFYSITKTQTNIVFFNVSSFILIHILNIQIQDHRFKEPNLFHLYQQTHANCIVQCKIIIFCI